MILANSSEKSFQEGSDNLSWCILRLFSSVQLLSRVRLFAMEAVTKKKFFLIWDE